MQAYVWRIYNKHTKSTSSGWRVPDMAGNRVIIMIVHCREGGTRMMKNHFENIT